MIQIDFRRVFGADQLVGHRGVVMAPAPRLADPDGTITDLASGAQIDGGELTVLDSPLWRPRGLALASYPAPPAAAVAAGSVAQLRIALLTEELRLLGTAVNACQRFLSGRHSGTVRLSAHPVVVQRMAALITGLHMVGTADLAASVATTEGRGWLSEEIDTAAGHLIKLSGGRAMLADQAVELRTLLSTLNRIYLEDTPCSR